MLLAGASVAAQAQVSAVAVDPNNSKRVWVANRENNTVTVINTGTNTVVSEITVGSKPRSLAFSADGSKVFVANQRGNLDVDHNFVNGFGVSPTLSSVSVISNASKTVVDTITDVGAEPYGVVVAPNGAYVAVSAFRAGKIRFYDANTHALVHTHEYMNSLDVIPSGFDINDVDEDGDFLADLGEPRAFVITADSSRLYVTHLIPGFVSVLDLTLDGSGLPTASVVAEKWNINEYAPHPILNPVNVQTIASQGVPRFLQDIALSPDGSTALIPHLLHNLNHDVNHSFGPGLAGDFANRVYPALTILDTATGTFDVLHHELADDPVPAAYVPYGVGKKVAGTVLSFNGIEDPLLSTTVSMQLRAPDLAGAIGVAFYGNGGPIAIPLGFAGTLYALPAPGGLFAMTHQGGGLHTVSLPIPNNPALIGLGLPWQSALVEAGGGPFHLSNGTRMVFGNGGVGQNKMGHRAGHPGHVLYNAAGDRAVMLNRGSEDVFLYTIDGSGNFELENVFPPRFEHVERTPFDTTTALGDLPLGMALVEDAGTANDDALLYVMNEITRTMSTLRIDWETGVISKEADQITTVLGVDEFTTSQLIGQEIFEDSSRAQTAGNFNNSCASCHFEGGADGNVWQRPAGPRSTMPVYGGTIGTGLILWKGVRLNMGETGPMFGGENGGHGVFTNAEQQGLIDYHEVIPFPVNPFLDDQGNYTGLAELGKDLFFGTNDSGLNGGGPNPEDPPALRHAGCTTCHPDADEVTLDPRFYTVDVLDPLLTDDPDGLENNDSFCFSLQENVVAINIRNVNSGVNVDTNPVDGVPDPDRNFDGYNDVETYTPLNIDGEDGFTRDDPNGYMCPQDPIFDPNGPQKFFGRAAELFSIPQKLGAFSTGPYMHDHSIQSLRALLDPASQNIDGKYGDSSRIGLQKFFNEFHDLRGHEEFVPVASKVQINLQSADVDADIEAILQYVRSL